MSYFLAYLTMENYFTIHGNIFVKIEERPIRLSSMILLYIYLLFNQYIPVEFYLNIGFLDACLRVWKATQPKLILHIFLTPSHNNYWTSLIWALVNMYFIWFHFTAYFWNIYIVHIFKSNFDYEFILIPKQFSVLFGRKWNLVCKSYLVFI